MNTIFFQIGPSSDGISQSERVALEEVLERIQQIAVMTPTELAVLMGSAEGSKIVDYPIERLDSRKLLRSWDSVGRASPGPLTEGQYETFLRGQHPLLETPLYGAHLEM
jgi:hypothetical protein